MQGDPFLSDEVYSAILATLGLRYEGKLEVVRVKEISEDLVLSWLKPNEVAL